MAHYDLLTINKSTFVSLIKRMTSALSSFNIADVDTSQLGDAEFTTPDDDNYTMRYNAFLSTANTVTTTTSTTAGYIGYSHGYTRTKAVLNEGVRMCYVKIPVKLKGSIGANTYYFGGDTTDFYLPVFTSGSPFSSYINPGSASTNYNSRMLVDFYNNGSVYRYRNVNDPDTALRLNYSSDNHPPVAMTAARLDGFNDGGFMPVTSDTLVKLKLIFADNTYYTPYCQYDTSSPNNVWRIYNDYIGCPYCSDSYSYTYFNLYCPTQFDAPVFDYSDATSIIKYLNTGDDSGKIDPFDPVVVEEPTVEDFTTNWVINITANTSNLTNKIEVHAYNEDFNENRGVLWQSYKTNVKYADSFGTTLHDVDGLGQYLSASFTTSFLTGVLANADATIDCVFSSIDGSDSSPHAHVWFTYKSNQAIKMAPATVTIGGNFCDRENITDGYKYTDSNTGATVTILFRAYTDGDQTDIYDSDYNDEEDEDDDTTGTDSTYITGTGLHTFPLTSAQFGTVNAKLWSTDWSEVFKSTTVDPIKCVISCKAIPFTANAGTLSHVIIANLDTELNINDCYPVKSFNIGTTTIPHIRGDFTDFTHTKVRCYLPFIGWVELPAEEVIGVRGYSDLGIQSKTRVIGFKYIVDFIDGNCRCIISVNDTERWYYDGNCGIDVPITSDGHTAAMQKSISSAIGTVASVGAIIGGIASAVGSEGISAMASASAIGAGATGLVKNAPNIKPTYSYSVSHSPSGYIEASMNHHIMIVVECPTVQEPSGYAHKLGKPCERNLALGSLSGYTQTRNVDVSSINATDSELNVIRSLLDSGVYL